MKQDDKRKYEQYLKHLEAIRTGAAANPLESKTEQLQRIKRVKADPLFFIEYYLAHYCTDPDTGKIIRSAPFHKELALKVKLNKRIKAFIRWGRAQAKSVWCNVVIPLWLWIQDDIRYMVIIGNNEDKAQILLSDIQAEFEANPRLIHDFGKQIKQGSWTDGYFITENGFTAKAIGMGQDARGLRMKAFRPDYISADDLEDKDTLKNPRRQNDVADWLVASVIPTMDGKRSRLLIANNLFAPRMIQTVLQEEHPDWWVHRVDAYDPQTFKPAWTAKYTNEHWIAVEAEIGKLAALAEYCNRPHIKGKIFTINQINWQPLPPLKNFKVIAAHWDVAYSGKNDYNAVRVEGLLDTNYWYIAGFCRQTVMRDAIIWMCYFQKALPVNVAVHWRFESQFWNNEVQRTIAEVEEETGVRLHLVKVDCPRKKKYDRIITLQPYYQNGRKYYNAKMKADPDTQVALQQLYGIEPGYKSHDDAPDAEQQVTEYLSRFTQAGQKISTGMCHKNLHRY